MNRPFLLVFAALLLTVIACNEQAAIPGSDNTAPAVGTASESISQSPDAAQYACFGEREKAAASRLNQRADVKQFFSTYGATARFLQDGICTQMENEGKVKASDLAFDWKMLSVSGVVTQEAKRQGLSELQVMAALIELNKKG